MPSYETQNTGPAREHSDSQLQYMGEMGQYRRQMEDAIAREQVPRDYHNQIRDYFKSLGRHSAAPVASRNASKAPALLSADFLAQLERLSLLARKTGARLKDRPDSEGAAAPGTAWSSRITEPYDPATTCVTSTGTSYETAPIAWW